jgi:hypothetical protein
VLAATAVLGAQRRLRARPRRVAHDWGRASGPPQIAPVAHVLLAHFALLDALVAKLRTRRVHDARTRSDIVARVLPLLEALGAGVLAGIAALFAIGVAVDRLAADVDLRRAAILRRDEVIGALLANLDALRARRLPVLAGRLAVLAGGLALLARRLTIFACGLAVLARLLTVGRVAGSSECRACRRARKQQRNKEFTHDSDLSTS